MSHAVRGNVDCQNGSIDGFCRTQSFSKLYEVIAVNRDGFSGD